MEREAEQRGPPKREIGQKQGAERKGFGGETGGRQLGQTLLRSRPFICLVLHSQQSTATGKSPSLVSLPPLASR